MQSTATRRIHCVISFSSPTSLRTKPLKPLNRTQARHALSSSSLTTSNQPSLTPHQHRLLSYTTTSVQQSRQHAWKRTQLVSCLYPANSARSQPAKYHSPTISHTSPFSSNAKTPTMSSDDAYMSFLDKANTDLNAGRATQQGTNTTRTQAVDATTPIPKTLESVDSYYISETDEPFEPVVLSWKGAKEGKWPSPDQLSGLISPDTDLTKAISTLTPSSFDPKNQYSAALGAVRSAAVENDNNADESAVEVKVYRVELSSTKIEYWVLALDGSKGRLVGLRAKSVES